MERLTDRGFTDRQHVKLPVRRDLNDVQVMIAIDLKVDVQRKADAVLQ